jgi:hypothetical protein
VDSSVIGLIVVAVLAVFSSVTAPLILAHRTERMHREDLLEEYERQDEVAAQARAANATMLAQQQLAAEAARLREETSHDLLRRINAQADRIHTLVNSDMTAVRQEELDQAEAMVMVLERVLGVAVSKGVEVEPEDVSALEEARTHRDKLQQVLADRLQQLRESEESLQLTEAGRGLDAEPANKGNRDAVVS